MYRKYQKNSRIDYVGYKVADELACGVHNNATELSTVASDKVIRTPTLTYAHLV